MKKRILIVTPKFPYPSYGACELDRAAGIEMFIQHGHEVYVITKVYKEEYKQEALAMGKKLGITIVPVTYKYLPSVQTFFQRVQNVVFRVFQPWYLDGAAYEYQDPEIRQEMVRALDSFKPDLVWFDYTYLWPLYSLAKKRGIPIVTRSINFEPVHFLEEDGRTLMNYIKFLPKLLSEYLVGKWSDKIFAITPQEESLYRRIGASDVVVLPLRGLSRCLAFRATASNRQPLNVFFLGSTYNVAHNRAALDFLLTQVIPSARSAYPGTFCFNILGAKVPAEYDRYFVDDVKYHGHIPFEKLSDFLAQMDIAIIPSLYGAGMQQKVFEPLARGFPTITSPRAMAGYPFKGGEHLLFAVSADEYVQALGKLRDFKERVRLGECARQTAEQIFAQKNIESIIFNYLSGLGI